MPILKACFTSKKFLEKNNVSAALRSQLRPCIFRSTIWFV